MAILWQGAASSHRPRLLPADTALAYFSQTETCHCFGTWRKKEISQSDLPQAREWMDKVLPFNLSRIYPGQMGRLSDFVGGEFGLVLTLDPSNNIPIPLPSGALVVPTPGLLIAVKVNDDTIFNALTLH